MYLLVSAQCGTSYSTTGQGLLLFLGFSWFCLFVLLGVALDALLFLRFLFQRLAAWTALVHGAFSFLFLFYSLHFSCFDVMFLKLRLDTLSSVVSRRDESNSIRNKL